VNRVLEVTSKLFCGALTANVARKLHIFHMLSNSQFIWYIDIFVKYNWVVTRWQYTFTHKQYTERYKTNNT